jgi:hypothetical protein
MPAERERETASRGSSAAEMKRTALAVALGWIVPGLGHAFLGRLRRGLIFGAIIWGSFGLGLAHQGRLALWDQNQPFLTSLQLVANLGIGPADLLARMVVYGKPLYRMPGSGGSIENLDKAELFRARARSGVSIYGTAYVWTAGLMNLLLLFDLWDLGRKRELV